MKKEYIRQIKKSVKAPDWMLKKGIFAVIVLLPLLFIGGMTTFIMANLQHLKEMEADVTYIETLVKKILPEQKKQKDVAVDEDYVLNVLGKMSFLAEDRKILAILCSEVAAKNVFPAVKERLSFLESGENTLQFLAQDSEKERIWSIARPVEMSQKDIKKLISHVEGMQVEPFFPNPNRPDLYFSSLQLTRVNESHSDVFKVDLQVVQKREN